MAQPDIFLKSMRNKDALTIHVTRRYLLESNVNKDVGNKLLFSTSREHFTVQVRDINVMHSCEIKILIKVSLCLTAFVCYLCITQII